MFLGNHSKSDFAHTLPIKLASSLPYQPAKLIFILIFNPFLSVSPLEYKFHEGRNFSVTSSAPRIMLKLIMSSKNICWMNKWDYFLKERQKRRRKGSRRDRDSDSPVEELIIQVKSPFTLVATSTFIGFPLHTIQLLNTQAKYSVNSWEPAVCQALC